MTAGDQLVHSAFLQSLASLAVGLSLEQLLCRAPAAPHHANCNLDLSATEWGWLAAFSTTVKSAEAFAKGTAFPESFRVPDLRPVGDSEIPKPLVG